MATSSIRRNFIFEGQDAIDFANSLDEAFLEKENRKPDNFEYVEITDKNGIKRALERFIKKWLVAKNMNV